MFERVYLVWDIYDGERSGLADYCGSPHYFECVLDYEKGGYTDVFEIRPIGADLLQLALEQWAIYRRWEKMFHLGEVPLTTHPGHSGQSSRYDELEKEIEAQLQSLPGPSAKVTGEFRLVEGQPELPAGCLREVEVAWTRAT